MFGPMSLLRGLSRDSFIPHFELIGKLTNSSITFLLRLYNNVFSGSWHTIDSESSKRWNESGPILFMS